MGPEPGERAWKAAGTVLGWLAVAAMLALGSTGVETTPAPPSPDAPAPLVSGR